MEDKSNVIVMSFDEAMSKYRNITSRLVNVEKFKRAGRRYELDTVDAAIYDEICDLEFLLGLDNNSCG